jgi:glutaminase
VPGPLPTAEADASIPPYVSTGTLPALATVRSLVAEAHERYRDVDDGANSDVYPALEHVPRSHFGICVVGAEGSRAGAGDVDVEFSIMSVAKPFVFALVCAALGPEVVRDRVGVNATGLPFNSVTAVERGADGRTNPMVNAGAIATTSLVPGADAEERWELLRGGLSAFAGRDLSLDEGILASASATNHRNQAIAQLLRTRGLLDGDPRDAVDLYTRQSSLRVTAVDLAVMGATLADGGVNPVTGVQVVDALSCRCTLAVMTVAGLYETSGDWLYDVGLPGKSGIGGGIVTVSPGKGGLGTYSPPLDGAGNSVRGQLVARFLSRRLGLDLFASEPVR